MDHIVDRGWGTSAHTDRKSTNLESLIEDEWDILSSWKDTMKKPESSVAEELGAVNAYAYHEVF